MNFKMPPHIPTNKDAFIFDLDGTIAKIDHRRHFVSGEKQDWDAFYEACDEDELYVEVVMMLQLLQRQGWRIYIFSGRSESVRQKTEDWLKQMMVRYDKLIMRPVGNFEPDEKLKRDWLYKWVEKDKIIAVFDDRQKVVDMWRLEGLPCFQVANGDF